MAIFPKIDVKQIIKDHFATLVNFSTGKPDGSDFFTFFWLPVATAFLAVRLSIHMDSDFVGVLISALSIFVGLLLNVIVILFEIVKNDKVSGNKVHIARESISNISFAILLSLISICLSLLTQMEWGDAFKDVSHFATYFIVVEFGVTILQVLKRMYVLFIDELREIEAKVKQENDPRRQVEIQSSKGRTFRLSLIMLLLMIALIFSDKIMCALGF